MKKILLVVISVLVMISGCTQYSSSGKLMIKMSSDPNSVFSGSQTTVYIDVENNSTRQYKDVEIKLFDCAGFISQGKSTCDCSKPKHNFNSGSFETLQCDLIAPDVPSTTTKTIHSTFNFNNEFDVIKTFELISNEEYQRRVDRGYLHTLTPSYYFSDGNIGVDLTFSTDLPIITNDDRYFYITISNVGDGFVTIKNTETQKDITVKLIHGSKIENAQCNIGNIDIIDNKKYPRIACKIPALQGDSESYDININIKYQYEFRQSLDIIVKK